MILSPSTFLLYNCKTSIFIAKIPEYENAHFSPDSTVSPDCVVKGNGSST
jgi:hypothetical protein